MKDKAPHANGPQKGKRAMSMKHFISIHDITGDEFSSLLDLALKLKKETKEGIPHPI